MSAGDSLGSCSNRGRDGHLPHPDGTPCLWTDPVSERLVAAAGMARRPMTEEELRDRIALLEQRNGELDADLHSSRLQHADTAAAVQRTERKLRSVTEEAEQLGRRLELELRASRDYAEQSATMSRRAAELRDRLAEVQQQSDERYVRLTHAKADLRAVVLQRDAMEEELRDLQRKAEQGMAVALGGRVYVQRDLLVASVQADLTDQPLAAHVMAKDRELREAGVDWCEVRTGDGQPLDLAGTELLPADRGVFVPIPAGHMLSVTVTPYDATPDDGSEPLPT